MTDSPSLRLIVDGAPLPFAEGDSVLTALLRAGTHPTTGGTLCAAGDCANCLASVNGVAYVRTCQTRARAGLRVERAHMDDYPPLPDTQRHGPEIQARHLHCDVVVVGQGESGSAVAAAARAAGKQVIALDAAAGEEVIGIYPGPQVVARTDAGMLNVHVKHEVVVATGAAEIMPVAPGNQLIGIFTARATALLHKAGIALGRVAAVGEAPEGVPCAHIAGELLRFEDNGRGRVSAVITRDAHGAEIRTACDSVSVGLGLSPRNGLARMAVQVPGLTVRTVGDAAREPDIPPCPLAGIVCACSGVSVDDLQSVWERGFHELELVKRSTLAGTGTCQGAACIPHIRSFLQNRGGVLQQPFTARPVARQLTMGEVAAGSHHTATPRSALDAEHRALGAYVTRVGGWYRPWNYGNVEAEYWAVREAVSIGDVSTLGKMQISGPDALEALERLYPTKVSTIKTGRSRYVLMLDERGYVLDDGLISKDSDTRYTLTFTSGGATTAELWVRDWVESWGLDVRLLNQTMSLGAINVTGPLATTLLKRLGLEQPLAFMEHRDAKIAGVRCKIYRLSFTGEQSYELHHPAEHSVALWRALMRAGAELGIKPHGIEALLKLRLEKGHIIVGQDSDFDSTPRRLNHDWAVKRDKPYFVGKQALLRTDKLPLDKMLVGLEMEGPAPLEGSVVYRGESSDMANYAGYVTSSTFSPLLRKTVMLAWVKLFDGVVPERVSISGRVAQRVQTPFYDPEAARARA